MNGMSITVDSSGRIVLPKPLRDRLRLRPGAELEISEQADGILLRPVPQKASLVRQGRFLLHAGTPAGEFDPVRAIDDDREDRMRHLLGQR
jgi:AbrB family looped-hinge helix DNA binding protein